MAMAWGLGSPLVLLVAPDAGAAEVLRAPLAAAGCGLRHARSGAAARALAREAPPSLVVLDPCLPDVDGLVLLASLVSQTGAPVLLRDPPAPRDRDLALRLGAADVLAWPIDPADLLARVRGHAVPPVSSSWRMLRAGDLRVGCPPDAAVGGRPLQLTRSEFALLRALATRPGTVVPIEALARALWPEARVVTPDVCGRAVCGHVRTLRAKLRRAGPAAPTIAAIRGEGYRLAASAPQVGARTNPTGRLAPAATEPRPSPRLV